MLVVLTVPVGLVGGDGGSQRGASEGEALAADRLGLLVDAPLRLTLSCVEEGELLCHGNIIPRGCDRFGCDNADRRTLIPSYPLAHPFTRGEGPEVPPQQGAPGATSGQGRSRSTTWARSRSSASSWWRPMICMPTGSPSKGSTGTEMAGLPAMLAGMVSAPLLPRSTC